MQIISSKDYNNYTKSQSIGKGNYILRSISSGITRRNVYKYQYQSKLIRPLKNDNTLHPFILRIVLINVENPRHRQNQILLKMMTPTLNFTRMKKQKSNRFLEHCCTMLGM